MSKKVRIRILDKLRKKHKIIAILLPSKDYMSFFAHENQDGQIMGFQSLEIDGIRVLPMSWIEKPGVVIGIELEEVIKL